MVLQLIVLDDRDLNTRSNKIVALSLFYLGKAMPLLLNVKKKENTDNAG
jgi:hypothetical protein